MKISRDLAGVSMNTNVLKDLGAGFDALKMPNLQSDSSGPQTMGDKRSKKPVRDKVGEEALKLAWLEHIGSNKENELPSAMKKELERHLSLKDRGQLLSEYSFNLQKKGGRTCPHTTIADSRVCMGGGCTNGRKQVDRSKNMYLKRFILQCFDISSQLVEFPS